VGRKLGWKGPIIWAASVGGQCRSRRAQKGEWRVDYTQKWARLRACRQPDELPWRPAYAVGRPHAHAARRRQLAHARLDRSGGRCLVV
jgi:hypothetical protein